MLVDIQPSDIIDDVVSYHLSRLNILPLGLVLESEQLNLE